MEEDGPHRRAQLASSKSPGSPPQSRSGTSVGNADATIVRSRGWLPTMTRVVVAVLTITGVTALFYSTVLLTCPAAPERILPPFGLLRTSWPVVRSSSRSHSADAFHTVSSLLTRSLPIGRRDFALAAAGGLIYSDLTSSTGAPPSTNSQPPDSVINDDFRLKGCWRVPRGHLQVGVVLAETIYPSHFTIDHAPQAFAHDIGEAPRTIVLWGVVDGSFNKATYAQLHAGMADSVVYNRTAPPKDAGFTFVPLAAVEYDPSADSHVQTFPVDDQVADSGIDIGLIVLDVISNWGSNTTSLCRVRVHGELSISYMMGC